MGAARDHGGGIDAAAQRYGGTRADWIDLSTGINPVCYPLPELPAHAWSTLPDQDAVTALTHAARRFWTVPDGAAILAAPGASSLIARIPALMPAGKVRIPAPTYNEHAGAFMQAQWQSCDTTPDATVLVHPNNPDGRLRQARDLGDAALRIIDESFCDVCPDQSLIALADRPGTLVLKSFGKFWGLAGLRLGFAIGDPALIARLAAMLGPWAVAGPALSIGTAALNDPEWTAATRIRLQHDADRLDRLVTARTAAGLAGGTPLFRLYDLPDSRALHDRLARARIWTRVFPYSDRWIRFGLPGRDEDWERLEAAL